MRADIRDDIRLGRCGEAEDRRRPVLLAGLDESGDVEVVRAEVMPPLGQAMRFIEYPGADLPVHQGIGERDAAELLGCDEDQSEITQAKLVQHDSPFEWRQQAIEVAGTGDSSRLEVIDLILHQRLKRRDHHREAAVSVVSRQRRQLEAQRLPTAGRQDRERWLAGKAVFDNGLLKRFAVRCGRR